MTTGRDVHRDFVGAFLLLVALYVGAFYLLPQQWGGPYPFGPVTRSSAFYNTVFYPMRRWTRTEIHQWDGWVEKVDLEKRVLLIMTSPRHGYFLPYRWRDDAAIRELKVWDRIHVSVAYLPHVQANTIHWEFRGYVRLPGEEDGD